MKRYLIAFFVLVISISGPVETSGDKGIDGVEMTGLPNNPITDIDGNYDVVVEYGWSGTVTPTKNGYIFTPTSKTYSNITSDQLNQDFIAAIPGPTDVNGIIDADTIWRQVSSPYIVTGTVLVEPDVVLTIEPGVEVRFDGMYQLICRGTLIAKGTSSSVITFTKHNTSMWGGIIVQFEEKFGVSQGYVDLSNIIIEYADIGLKVRQDVGSKSSIKSGIFRYNGLALDVVSMIDFDIGHNIIHLNGNGIKIEGVLAFSNIVTTNTGYGIDVHGHVPLTIIEHNLIANNGGCGIIVYTGQINHNTVISNKKNGLTVEYGSPYSDIQYNNIFHNSPYSLYRVPSYYSYIVQANNNWWGTSDEAEINNLIYDYYDNWNLGKVDYSSYLQVPDSDAPISPPGGLTFTNISSQASTQDTGSISIEWTANPESDTAGYKVYWDIDSGYPYSNVVDVGNVSSHTLTNLEPNTTYFIAVTAYDSDYAAGNDDPDTIINDNQTNGNESWYSEEVVNYTLTVRVNPSGGDTVTKNPDSSFYSPDDNVELTASPNPGYVFSNWSGDVPSGKENDNPLTITMDSSKNLIANFSLNTYTLTVQINPLDSGGVSKNPDNTSYNHGETVELTATASTGYSFSGWTGDVPGENEIDNPLTVTMDSNKTIAANYSSLSANLEGAIAVFVNSNKKLRKIDAVGNIERVLNTDPDVNQIQFSPSGQLFIVFSSKQYIANSGLINTQNIDTVDSYLFVKVNPDDGSVVGIDKDLSSMVWRADSVNPNIQFDGNGNIFYLAWSDDNFQILRKYIDETNKPDLINENIRVSNWLVRSDGTIVLSGSSVPTNAHWLRKITPQGALSNLAMSSAVRWILDFPDNRVYVGIWGSAPYFGVYKLSEDLSYISNDAAMVPYIGVEGLNGLPYDPDHNVSDIISGYDPFYCEGFRGVAGTYMTGYARTKNNQIIGLAGRSTQTTPIYYYPIPKILEFILLDKITMIRESLNQLVVVGTKDGINKLILYDISSGEETNLLYEDIEIYHLDILSNGYILFDGLKFANSTNVVGMFERAVAASNVRISVDDYTYKELSLLDGKPTNFKALFTEVDDESAVINVSKNQLFFGATSTGEKTSGQKFSISNTGFGTLSWTISDDKEWLSCTNESSVDEFSTDYISGTGSAMINVSVNPSGLSVGEYQASIYITSTNASNSPQVISVNLKVYETGSDSAPFGYFDTPTNNTTVSGSVAVTGWALDDIEVNFIEIKRDPDPDDNPAAIGSDGLVHIGYAFIVQGSRTDIEALYFDYPHNNRAGWGYMMLTFGLPRRGNGSFKLYAFAEDLSGKRTLLGTKDIVADNSNSVKPFGAIDTPGPGQTWSGTQVNFGWALTPPPKWIPYDGSTIYWSIDSVIKGKVDYGDHRADIEEAFPEYLNSAGAGGHKYIDTTQYTNSVHTIGWLAYDSDGVGDGMGSRFFEIQNVGGVSAETAALSRLGLIEDTRGFLEISTTEDRDIEIEELGSIKLEFKAKEGLKFVGWGEDLSKDLPIGSTLDEENGIFYWMPGPGFLNQHVLHFAVTDGAYVSQPVEVIVNIVPKRYKIERKRKDRTIKRLSTPRKNIGRGITRRDIVDSDERASSINYSLLREYPITPPLLLPMSSRFTWDAKRVTTSI